ncbi:hypothetical protein [Pseudomonas sp. Marseille-QA0892]
MTKPKADSRNDLIKALQQQGLFYVRDLPGHMKVVRQAKVVEFRV